MLIKRGQRGQVTIFIIIAIVLVAVVVLFVTLRQETTSVTQIPTEFQPIYETFRSCNEQNLRNGILVLESQAGYIEVPEFQSGSTQLPLSNQLDFLGLSVPYWWTLTGNGIAQEQVPSESDLEEELETFVLDELGECDFQTYIDQGFVITLDSEDAKADVSISDNNVDLSVDVLLTIEKDTRSTLVQNHEFSVDSPLGSLYNTAKEIYNAQQRTLFLENYTVDVLRFYAPVDGVEVSCAPKTWIADDVIDNVQNALEGNIVTLKTQGNYYDLSSSERKYFVVPVDTGDTSVQFLTSKDWPYRIEVFGSVDNGVMLASPVGNQPGLGILGFCYVPYHFVYDAVYPVLVQVSRGEETFQFPIAVIVSGNKPRVSDPNALAIEYGLPELCAYRNSSIGVSVVNSKLQSVDAAISFECFGTQCSIGNTEDGFLQGDFPACVNGIVRARADGYREARYSYSTNREGDIELVLDKLYPLQVALKKDGKITNDRSIVSFTSDQGSSTLVYPEQTSVQLAEGQYSVSVMSFSSFTLDFPEQQQRQCVDVPSGGLGSIFGATKQQCFDITIPAQSTSEIPSGGGTQEYYVAESELESSRTVEIDFDGFSSPRSIEELPALYELVNAQGLEIEFV